MSRRKEWLKVTLGNFGIEMRGLNVVIGTVLLALVINTAVLWFHQDEVANLVKTLVVRQEQTTDTISLMMCVSALPMEIRKKELVARDSECRQFSRRYRNEGAP